MKATDDSGTVVDSPEIKALEAKVEEARGLVKKTERDLNKAQKRLAESKELLRKTSDRRGILLLPARGGNAEAQAEIDRMDQERKPIERDVRDDEECVERLSQYLDAFKAKLAAGEREVERTKLLQKIHARMEASEEAELLAAVNQIKELWSKLLQRDKVICEALIAFDPDLKREFRSVDRMHETRAELLTAELKGIIRGPLSGAYLQALSRTDLESHKRRTFEDVINNIEYLDLAS